MHISLIAHNLRSTHNVGALFRTCDGLGIDRLILSGYTPYPQLEDDTRLPHLADKLTRQIHKTALGAESEVSFVYYTNLDKVLVELRQQQTVLIALEQATGSLTPATCKARLQTDYSSRPVALLLGNELDGVSPALLEQMDLIMEIPMQGRKESLNVSVAAGIGLFVLASA